MLIKIEAIVLTREYLIPHILKHSNVMRLSLYKQSYLAIKGFTDLRTISL